MYRLRDLSEDSKRWWLTWNAAGGKNICEALSGPPEPCYSRKQIVWCESVVVVGHSELTLFVVVGRNEQSQTVIIVPDPVLSVNLWIIPSVSDPG